MKPADSAGGMPSLFNTANRPMCRKFIRALLLPATLLLVSYPTKGSVPQPWIILCSWNVTKTTHPFELPPTTPSNASPHGEHDPAPSPTSGDGQQHRGRHRPA